MGTDSTVLSSGLYLVSLCLCTVNFSVFVSPLVWDRWLEGAGVGHFSFPGSVRI